MFFIRAVPIRHLSRDCFSRCQLDANNGEEVRLIEVAMLIPLLLQNGTTSSGHHPSIESETLLQSSSSWDGTLYTAYPSGQPELSVLKITLPPHTTLRWHTHSMPNAGYVLSGELTVERKGDGRKQTFRTGQVVPEMVDALHRGIAGDEPVTLIVFYAGTKGMPLSH
jgi:quercetin dioxygenase-like cupin family protein